MEVEILVPLGLFTMIVLIVWISVRNGSERRKATLNVIESAIRQGQTMTPETIKALGMPRKDGRGDLKAGLILVAVAAAFATLGMTIGAVEGDNEAVPIMLSIAAFPGFIGLVLIGFGLTGKKSSDQD
ncbi:DUF6249 domain-containing protein [Maricaulis sp. D1M11]|uniref:DUF6249 domain-containing protein n=1 Tax=Maricaulis sp. D1M11 TaxID=3076117 RepID=UPI0039B40369